MKQVIIRASQSDFGQVDFYSYLPKGQVKENGGCSTPVFTLGNHNTILQSWQSYSG